MIKVTIPTLAFLLMCAPASEEPLSPSAQKQALNNNQFALNFLKEIYTEKKNCFYSPYSISSALAMTYAGAKSSTEQQMRSVLNFQNQELTHTGFGELSSTFNRLKQKEEIELAVANALWKKKDFPFKQEFIENAKANYSTPIYPLTSASPINIWASKHTKGKISKLVTDGDLANAKMVLTNAIYFKGDWLTQFKKENTKQSEFYGSTTTKVDMMNQQSVNTYFENSKLQALTLPYLGESVSMTIVLPKHQVNLASVIKTLTAEEIKAIQNNYRKEEVNIQLPKFKLKTSYSLNKTLSNMGMSNAFAPQAADFSAMSPVPLFISNVIHKAVIEVNEEGSEAAAATAVVVAIESVELDPIKSFIANRPFMFFISEKTSGSILFMGCVNNL